jgi:dTDP-4-dehydrorhamnose 3,5-epimerase
MRIRETELDGARLIELEKRGDERGFFARTFCEAELAAAGLVTRFVQANHSHNKARGTLRGMHFQRAPHGEVKLVRVVRGAIYDVIIDLRRESPTYGRWQGFDLTAENGLMLYVPVGFAHGLQTLADDTDIAYQVSHPYTPDAEGGVRWDDLAFGIVWPLPVAVISPKDAAWPSVDLAAGVAI